MVFVLIEQIILALKYCVVRRFDNRVLTGLLHVVRSSNEHLSWTMGQLKVNIKK